MNFKKNLFLFLVVFCNISGHSEIRNHLIEVTPLYGYNLFQPKQNLKDSTSYGGRLSYHPSMHLGVESSLEFITSEVMNKSLSEPVKGQFLLSNAPDKVKIKFYYLDLIYNFSPEKNWIPFMFLGFGGASYTPKIQTEDLLLINAGLGLKYYWNDILSFRFDVKDIYVGEFLNNGFHNYNMSFGIQIALNKYTPRPKKIEEEEGLKLNVIKSHVFHFDVEGAILNRASIRILKDLVTTLKHKPHTSVYISGFASASGNQKYNEILSERRANVVRDYFLNKGISSKRLHVKAYGSSKPAVKELNPEDDNSPEARSNRRVLVEIVKD